jgi:2,4-dienoyl-CoA reductase-like NADH-dependent reductase (Old Yellow Enzyme family)
MHGNDRRFDALFKEQNLGQLKLRNRVVMPPMGFHSGLDGVPDADVAEYYRRRAEGGAGLILTEGAYIDHPSAGDNPLLLRFDSEDALAGWGRVVDEVHSAGAKIIPELWHVGLIFNQNDMLAERPLSMERREHLIGPSGFIVPGKKVGDEMSQAAIDDVIAAFVLGAENAMKLGFDGVELHGAHGYLIDQFFWEPLNQRVDAYGGSIANRSRFAAEIVAGIRHRLGPDFPILLRISQWKLHDYSAEVVRSPAEMEEWLSPLVEAGVDVFDCSQRRFWQPVFSGSDLNLAGWVKKLTGKPAITVGSVGLDLDMVETLGHARDASPAELDDLIDRLEREEFDLVAVGRGQIADPDWANKVRQGRFRELLPFNVSILSESPSHADLA